MTVIKQIFPSQNIFNEEIQFLIKINENFRFMFIQQFYVSYELYQAQTKYYKDFSKFQDERNRAKAQGI